MASTQIPSPMDRRHLLEKRMDADQAIALADAYLEADRAVEALDFFAKAGAMDRLEEVAEQAIEAGDAFLLKSVLDAQGVEHAAPERWERLGAAAERAGKTLYASVAHRMANPLTQD